MKNHRIGLVLLFLACILSVAVTLPGAAGGYTLVGWNNLGMHCMDSDYSVFSILPPYNTIQAHLINSSGKLVTSSAGVTVTFEALTDPSGSINTTSANKTNFWDQVFNLFGVSLPVDSGLAGNNMPGAANVRMPMKFDSSVNAFIAEGIPITPYDDAGQKNYYPMMHLLARDGAGNILAATDIVLPVSDEMDCRACHGSDAPTQAQPAAGWVRNPDPVKDYRLNILLLHDQYNGASVAYKSALVAAAYDQNGLYATANGGKSVLCARCHASNALAGTGLSGIAPLTRAIHGYHAEVTDPTNGQSLDSSANRSACYRCHPGSQTRCLRGSMGSAVAADGTMAIQCQSCHGSMSAMGSTSRQGWLNEPTCQNCHTGTATVNSGQIRYTSAFDPSGTPRVPADSTFATNPNTPAAGISLYRFSKGHGGLQCSACHHSTHAEYPSSHVNDNIQSLQLQNHLGMIADCTTCHNTQPSTANGGPHGLHPVGQSWASNHDSAVERSGSTACQVCHGTDYRGTILSRALGDRNVSTRFGTKQFWRSYQIGCYTCHNGPRSESPTPNSPPVANNGAITADSQTPTSIVLSASDPDGNAIQLRIVSQPSYGTVALSGTNATYFPSAEFAGSDSFTFAASDGSLDSNLAVITLNVARTFLVPFYQTSPTTYTGIAISNYSDRIANAQITALGADGQPLALPSNPAGIVLQPRNQVAKLGQELFGDGQSQTQSGWLQIAVDNPSVGCLFLFGSARQLDGSNAQLQTSKHFWFTRVLEGPLVFRGQTASTYLSIANPSSQSITLTLNLFGPTSAQVLAPAQTKTIPARGALYGTVSNIFGQRISASGAYVDVQVTSGPGAVGFELIQFPDRETSVGLYSVSDNSASEAYSAQLAVNTNYFTNLKLINTGTATRTVALSAISDAGANLAQSAALSLAPGQSLEQDAAQAFSLAAGSTLVGSLVVNVDGPGVSGDVMFGDPSAMNFAAALPLQTRKFSHAVFDQVANADGYFTGLALFNPNAQSASITLEVFSEAGALTGTFTTQLGADARISRLLTDLVPASTGQMRGFVRLSSTLPIIAQQLFGDGGLSFLSAVSPTIIQ